MATAWLMASSKGDPQIVRALIAGKADVNGCHSNGDTPLLRAAANGHLAIVRDLIAAGANLRGPPLRPQALAEAAANGHPEVVKALIDAKANVNAEVRNGDTPLLRAAAGGHLEIARTLIAAGRLIERLAPKQDRTARGGFEWRCPAGAGVDCRGRRSATLPL